MTDELRIPVDFDQDVFDAIVCCCEGICVEQATIEACTILLNRYPCSASGIDWTKHPLTHQASLKNPSESSDFVRDAVTLLGISEIERVVCVADRWINAPLSCKASCLPVLASEFHSLPFGYLFGPIDCSWDWVIDIRFARAAFAGRMQS